jgi:hypothetical protein
MPDVSQKGQIATAIRKTGIRSLSLAKPDVVRSAFPLQLLFQDFEHCGLQIDSPHHPCWSNRAGKGQGEKSSAGADVGNHHSGLEI